MSGPPIRVEQRRRCVFRTRMASVTGQMGHRDDGVGEKRRWATKKAIESPPVVG